MYRTEEPLVLPCSFLLLLTLTIAIPPTNLFNTLRSSPLHPSPLPLAKCVSGIGVFGSEGRHVSTYLMTWRRLVVVVENDEFVLRDEIVDVMWYGW